MSDRACSEYSHFWNLQRFLRACELVIRKEQVSATMVRRESQVLMHKCNDCHPAWTQLLGILETGAGMGRCRQAEFAARASLVCYFLPALKAEFLYQCFCDVKFFLNLQNKTKCCSIWYGTQEHLGDADRFHSQMQKQEHLWLVQILIKYWLQSRVDIANTSQQDYLNISLTWH